MSGFKILCVVVLFCCGVLPAVAQYRVQARLDTNLMLIGDQRKLFMQVIHEPGIVLKQTDLSGLDSIKGVEILKPGKWNAVQGKEGVVEERVVTFTVWDTGKYQIPAVIFTFDQNGQTMTASSNDLPLRILNPPLDSTLAPIHTIIQEPFSIEDAIPYAAAVLVIVAMIILVWWWLQWRKRPMKAPIVAEIVLAPHELALQKLQRLAQQSLWQQGYIKEYQSELNYIFREYLEKRYGILALESTSDEILKQIRQTDMPSEIQQKLKGLFETADLVKFAQAEPPVEVHAQMMEEILKLIESTKPEETVVTGIG